MFRFIRYLYHFGISSTINYTVISISCLNFLHQLFTTCVYLYSFSFHSLSIFIFTNYLFITLITLILGIFSPVLLSSNSFFYIAIRLSNESFYIKSIFILKLAIIFLSSYSLSFLSFSNSFIYTCVFVLYVYFTNVSLQLLTFSTLATCFPFAFSSLILL